MTGERGVDGKHLTRFRSEISGQGLGASKQTQDSQFNFNFTEIKGKKVCEFCQYI